jgi:hypothetical protein
MSKLREVLDDAGDHKAGVMTCPPASGRVVDPLLARSDDLCGCSTESTL